MRHFANWDQALGFYTAYFDLSTFDIAPTLATQERPGRLFATQQQPANLGSENHPIFVASTTNSPIFVASTAGSPISVSSTAPTPVAAPRFAPRVPQGIAPVRGQSIGTPTPTPCAIQPFPMPAPSPNFGKATPSPGPPAPPAVSLTTSGPIIIPDSDNEDKDEQPGTLPTQPFGKVIVIGDDDDDSALPQRPYPTSPSNPPAPPSPVPATPVKGTRRFKPLFSDGYSPRDFFTPSGNLDNIAASPSAPNVSLRARKLEKKILEYMKTPPATSTAAAARAARGTKPSVNANAASSSTLPEGDGQDSDYGIAEFDAAGLQELDAIMDSLANGK